MIRTHNSQQGSVFIYILIAVTLLGALTYAVSRGNRANTNALTSEQAKLAAQEIIEYGNTVATAVQKLRLRGVADTEISFENSVYEQMNGDLEYPASEFPNCVNAQCKVFDIDGGGVTPSVMPDFAVANLSDRAGTSLLRPGYSWFASIKIEGIGSTNNDLVLRTPFLKTETCLKINDLLGIDNPGGTPPEETITGWAHYQNTYTGTGVLGDEATNLKGRRAFCARWPGGSLGDDRENHFYQVLIAR